MPFDIDFDFSSVQDFFDNFGIQLSEADFPAETILFYSKTAVLFIIILVILYTAIDFIFNS